MIIQGELWKCAEAGRTSGGGGTSFFHSASELNVARLGRCMSRG